MAPKGKRKTGIMLVTFHRFERSLGAGAVLDVWVFKQGQIGSFTALRLVWG